MTPWAPGRSALCIGLCRSGSVGTDRGHGPGGAGRGLRRDRGRATLRPVALPTVSANGVEFAYLEDGPEDGPLALCLHGFPDTAHTWRYLLPRLADAGFHAVAPFMRGYAPDVGARGRPLRHGDAGPRRLRAPRGARRRRGRRDHRARLGRLRHLRCRRPPTRALAAVGDGRRRPPGLDGRGVLLLRPVPSQLVRVLLPDTARRDAWWLRTTTPSSTACGRTGRPASTGPGMRHR